MPISRSKLLEDLKVATKLVHELAAALQKQLNELGANSADPSLDPHQEKRGSIINALAGPIKDADRAVTVVEQELLVASVKVWGVHRRVIDVANRFHDDLNSFDASLTQARNQTEENSNNFDSQNHVHRWLTQINAALSECRAGIDSEAQRAIALGTLAETTSKKRREDSLTEQRFRFYRSGTAWEVEGFGERGHLANLIGIPNLISLLRKPGVCVPYDTLDPRMVGDPRSRQPATDLEALRACFQDQKRLEQEIRESDNDVDREDSRQQLTKLKEQMSKAVGFGGKPYDLNSDIRRRQSKIRGRLNEVFDKMRESVPPLAKLAEHFERFIKAKSGFSYNPPKPVPVWELDPDEK